MAKTRKRKHSKPIWFDETDMITPLGQKELHRRVKKLRKTLTFIRKDFDDDTQWLTSDISAGIRTIESHYCIEDWE